MKSLKIIVLITVLCLAALIAAGCGGAEQRKAKYLERGKEYLAQENYDKASVELRNVIQIDPKNAEAYYLIGQVQEKKRNWQQAFGNYSKATELKPDYIEPRLRLSYFYFMGGNVDKASATLDEILKAQPNNASGRTLRAAIMAKKGDIKGATQEAEKVIAEDPSQTEAIELLGSIYAKQNDMEKIQDILVKGIAANPKNFPMRAQYARLLAAKKDIPGAEKVLQESISLQPDNFAHRLLLATFYSQLKQADKAEKTLRDAIQANPDDGERYIVLADFLVGQKKVDQAKEELIAAINAKPKLNVIRMFQAKLYKQTREWDKAMQVYRDIIEANGTKPDGLNARNQLAELMMQEGKQDEAGKLVAEVLKENPRDNDALYIKGKLALLKQDAPTAITAFSSIIRDQPDFVDAYLSLADAHMLGKNQDLAKENIQKAVELNPNSVKARLALAKYFIYTGDLDAASKKINEALKISPNDLDALQAKVEFLLTKKDMKGVQVTLEKMKAAHPDNAIGYYQLGQLYASQKKYDGAIREFEQAMEKSQDTFRSLTAIVNTNLAQGKPGMAISRLDAIIKKTPAHPFAHELLGEVYSTQKKYDEAQQSLRKAIEANPKWNVPYRNLANVYLVRGDFTAASQISQEGLKVIPEDAQLLMYLAGAYERTHDYDHAIATYERVLSKNADDGVAANNLASLLAEYKTDAQSLKRARELAKRFESSQQPAFIDTLG